MIYTKNFKLSKPSYDDDVDVQILNNNMDILDDNLKRTNDKFSQYLPLTGGTMKGDITVPQEVGLRYDTHTVIKFIMQNALRTIRLEGERISFQTPNGSTFKVDDEIRYNDKIVPYIISDSIGDTRGHLKLSNELLLQWGYVDGGDYDGQVRHATFTTPMRSSTYLVFVSKSNFTADKPATDSGNWFSATYNYNTTGFDIITDSKDTSNYWFWFAIGA